MSEETKRPELSTSDIVALYQLFAPLIGKDAIYYYNSKVDSSLDNRTRGVIRQFSSKNLKLVFVDTNGEFHYFSFDNLHDIIVSDICIVVQFNSDSYNLTIPL